MEAVEKVVGAVEVEAPADKSSIKKVVGAAMAGTIAEWYEFFIFNKRSTKI